MSRGRKSGRRSGKGKKQGGKKGAPKRFRQAKDVRSRVGAQVGLVSLRGKYTEVEPLFQKGPTFLLARGGVRVKTGDLVLFRPSHGRRVQVTKVIGRREVLQDVLDALLEEGLVQRGFGREVLAEAEQVGRSGAQEERPREDLRELFTFTVDPATARDFDDALSFTEEGENTVVYVHIADVSHYVEEGTALDREALRRGTSVYIPTGVEPMLPEALSAGVCSLVPGEDRKTVTVEMNVGSDGSVRSSRFYRSLIRSDARLNYVELEEMFRGEQKPSDRLAAALDLGRPLAANLEERRRKKGSLSIESTEPEFIWDSGGRLTDARAAKELESHRFIEHFMILANTQVARFLEGQRVPTVYRVHDLPDPFALDHLLELFASLDLPIPSFDPITATPRVVRRVMMEAGEMVRKHAARGQGRIALMQQVLRAQSRAVYQAQNIGHFGLALDTYCHFTSPIRRYPDLLVHRHLLGALGVGPQPYTANLSDWAEHCSRTEREAGRMEMKGTDIALAHILKKRFAAEGRGMILKGEIVGFVGAGAFILFDGVFEGFLPARDMPGDYYELNDLESAMVGRKTGRAYRLADMLSVRVSEVDEARGRVDLELADK